MMPLEKQLCSLEPSRRLKELGVKQNAIFYWDKNGELMRPDNPYKNPYVDYAAFSVAELGEMLPKLSKCWNNARGDTWICEYMEPLKPDNMKFFNRMSIDAATEADARCAMLIYLIEKGLVNAKDIK